MRGKYDLWAAFTVLSIVLFLGCAQPKYESTKESIGNAGQFSQEQKTLGCATRFASSGLCLSWKWEEVPTSSKPGALIFKVYRGNTYDDSPVPTDPILTPSVVLWMPSMGHGSSPTTVTRLDIGTYRATNVFFIMPGEWEIRFQTKEGSTIQDEAIVTLTI